MSAVATAGDALLRDVLEHPDDDTPRLILADWLEEHGGEAERADFIRSQVVLATYKRETCPNAPVEGVPESLFGYPVLLEGENPNRCGRCRWCGLKEQEKALLNAHGLSRWVPNGWEGWVEGRQAFHRGFIETLRMDGDSWVQHADTILAQHPIEQVQLTIPPSLAVSYSPFDGNLYGLEKRAGLHVTATEAKSAPLTALLNKAWPKIRFHGLRSDFVVEYGQGSIVEVPAGEEITVGDLLFYDDRGRARRALPNEEPLARAVGRPRDGRVRVMLL